MLQQFECCFGGAGDEAEFALQGGEPLTDSKLVTKPRSEPLKVRMIPKQFRRIIDAGAANDTVLGQNGRAQVVEQFVRRAVSPDPVVYSLPTEDRLPSVALLAGSVAWLRLWSGRLSR